MEDVSRDDRAGEARLEDSLEHVIDEQVKVLHAEGHLGVVRACASIPFRQAEDGIWQYELNRSQSIHSSAEEGEVVKVHDFLTGRFGIFACLLRNCVVRLHSRLTMSWKKNTSYCKKHYF